MKENNRVYLICIIFFISAFLILEFNLSEQGIFIDEVFHHTFGLLWYDYVVANDFQNSCITGLTNCDMPVMKCDGVHLSVATGGLVKGIFTGMGDEFFSDNERIYYGNLEPCRPIHNNISASGENIPSPDELGSARFFFPIFGSLSIVVSFLIGRNLFSNLVGIVFGSVLLFHSLFMLYSRIIQSEIFLIFFILLSVFLILHTFKTQNKIQFKYLILSGITFALAINVKLTAIEIVPLLLIIIFWRGSFNQKISFSQFKEKFFLSKSILLLCVFSVVVFSSVLVTNPYYYSNPIEQLKEQYDDLNTLSEMYEDNRPTWSPIQEYYMPFLGTTSVTFVPLLDTYYYIFDPENIPESASIGHTFTSVPLSILFLIGILYLLNQIKTRKLLFSEFIILTWFLSFFITISLGVESYNLTKYYVLMILPISLIMSYGFVKFINKISKNTIRVVFFVSTISAHAITYLVFWENIYFNSEKIWRLPYEINLQKSISEPITLISSLIFLSVLLIIIGIKLKSRYAHIKEN